MNENANTKTTKKISTAGGITLAFSLLLTGVGIYIDLFLTLAYGWAKFNISFVDALVLPLLIYLANFMLLFIVAKKINCGKIFSKLLLILDIFLRVFFIVAFLCLFTVEFSRLIHMLLMTIPCLSGAIVARIILSRKEKKQQQ